MAPLIPVCLIDSGTKAAGHSTAVWKAKSEFDPNPNEASTIEKRKSIRIIFDSILSDSEIYFSYLTRDCERLRDPAYAESEVG